MIAVYARQSIDREDSISTDSQIEACLYEIRGEAYKTYVDKGYSGKNTDRPCFKRLISDIKNGSISKVVVYRLDRISRSILDFANMMVLFSKYHVEFISSTEKFDTSTPMGRAMLNICMVFAQLERETIQQRVTDAYYSRSEKGFYMGGRVPYGFRLKESFILGKRSKKYVVCDEEAEQIRLMYALYSDPCTSYGDIITYFNNNGITCRGKPWSRSRIADHLKNPIYVRADLDVYEFFQQYGTVIESPQEEFIGTNGCYYYKGRDTHNRKMSDLKDNRLVLAPSEGIVPSDIWLKCRIKCLHNKQIQTARKAVNTWLAGLVKCGNCHYALISKKSNNSSSRYLVCSCKMNSKACKGAGTIYTDEFENIIYNEMVDKLDEFPVLFKYGGVSQKNPEAVALRIKLNDLGKEINALMDKVASADEALMQLINGRIEKLMAEQNKFEQKIACSAKKFANDDNLYQIHDYLNKWDRITLDDKRRIACSLIEVIYATSEKVDIYWKI